MPRDPTDYLNHIIQTVPLTPKPSLGNHAKSASRFSELSREEIIQELVLERKTAEETIRLMVDSLRKDGKTWRELGELLGVSHESARKHYG